MFGRSALLAVVAGCPGVGCRGADAPSASPEALATLRLSRSQYDSLAVRLRQSLPFLGEPLKQLTPEQQASVAALILVTRVATEHQLAVGTLLEDFWTDVPEVCPPLRSVTFTRGGCLDAEIAYASAMAKCQAEGDKTDDECERDAAPDAAAAVACTMREIEQLVGAIRLLPGRRWPPGPFPWPIEP